eukprot:GHVU01085931.1.p2 GENE.GHVU01085931.1~~GHVU01085931.1.p2  ORF type:complete len:113 (+),score=9.48 GHVU01085931.1:1126-1464(+)
MRSMRTRKTAQQVNPIYTYICIVAPLLPPAGLSRRTRGSIYICVKHCRDESIVSPGGEHPTQQSHTYPPSTHDDRPISVIPQSHEGMNHTVPREAPMKISGRSLFLSVFALC